jgi:diguanylate cyclase (GGDEF)-like protein/PAS domain S-box-containing protein
METRRNIVEHNAPLSLLKSSGRVRPHKKGRERGRFEVVFSHAPIGMALVDMNDCWLRANDALCCTTGHTEAELKAKALRPLMHPDDIDLDAQLLRQLCDGEISSYQVEKRFLHALGQFIWMMITVSLVRNSDGRALYLIMQFQDISERKELAGRLEYLANHDFLTGLYNRRHFELELAREVDRAARYESPGAVLLIDVDNFKIINDTFGHMAGDDLLKGIAGLLKHRVRHTDILARIGGDEFAVLLPQTNVVQATAVADSLIKELDKHLMLPANQSIHITVSAGVASLTGVSAAEVLVQADFAMYAAKKAGRNRFVVYKPFAGGRDQRNSRFSETELSRELPYASLL